MSPGRVLRRHPDDELFHVDGDSRTPGPAARRAVVLAGDQLAVPAQDRVGRDQARELAQPATTHRPALDGQSSPLVIGEPQAPPADLLAEDAVLLAQEVDDSSWREWIQPVIHRIRNRTASVPIAATW